MDHTTLPAPVLEALRQGNKIEAIKRMREQAGLGLKEAKDAVEAYEASAAGLTMPAGLMSGQTLASQLSPGQVRSGPSALGWIVCAIVAIGALAYFLF
jgi:hypothetical protein